MNVLSLGSLLLALVQAQSSAAYYDVPLSELELGSGEVLPLWGDQGPTDWEQYDFLWPYAVLEGPGEVVYFLPGAETPWMRPAHGTGRLLVRTDAPRAVKGSLFVPRADWNGMVRLEFTIPAARATASETDFLRAELARVERLWNLRVPGAAWFRHRANELSAQVGESAATEEQQNFQALQGLEREGDLSATYGLFSGGRALAENLQLERVLPSVEPGEEKVKLASIQGISVREFDWKRLYGGLEPALDPLAALVPADQHALFFPSFEALAGVLDETARLGEFALSAFEDRSSDAGTRARLERQLCLELDGLSRALGPLAIESVAVTGSDPYLRTGSDVALLFETKSLPALRAFVVARQDAAAAGGARSVEGAVGVTTWRGVVSRTRAVSSYLAEIGNAVVVSNSLGQLERIAGVAAGEEPALAAADEYRFFRGRYPRGSGHAPEAGPEDGTGDETAQDAPAADVVPESLLLVLPDAAIRRWCSPRWRIAASRRTRAAAVLADLTAAHADDIARGVAEERTLAVDPRFKSLGEVQLTSDGVFSSVYGTLGFLTPIAELAFDEVEKREAELYALWREGYQSNWSNYFDPIAVSLAVGKDRIAADLTVMPLILESEYGELRGFAGNAALDPADGDPHPGALVHFAMALDPESEKLTRYGSFITGVASQLTEPMGWLGGSFAVFLDEDPVWENVLAAEDPEEVFENLQAEINRIPLVVVFEVKSAVKLAAFLAGLRAFVDGTAPGMVSWTEREDAGRRFVEIGANEAVGEDMSIFYATTPGAWILSLQREALLRALDRQKAAPPAEGELAQTWLGGSAALDLDGRGLPLLELFFEEELFQEVVHNSWSNLPILGEWKRRFPDEDPVLVHQRVFGERLECPGGEGYAWNETWHTMESKVFRHPGEPPARADLKSMNALVPAAWRGLARARFGLTFEDEGLRARAEIRRK